ncbi:hypothetical protein Efla_000784 [Eimeria flavescens]
MIYQKHFYFMAYQQLIVKQEGAQKRETVGFPLRPQHVVIRQARTAAKLERAAGGTDIGKYDRALLQVSQLASHQHFCFVFTRHWQSYGHNDMRSSFVSTAYVCTIDSSICIGDKTLSAPSVTSLWNDTQRDVGNAPAVAADQPVCRNSKHCSAAHAMCTRAPFFITLVPLAHNVFQQRWRRGA